MLIDYSKNMTLEQIQLAHKMTKLIYDKLNARDRIGLIVFNENNHQSFPL